MSWRIAADVRESFVEVGATNGETLLTARTVNRKDNLISGLSEALQVMGIPTSSFGESSLCLTSDLERVALRERWGQGTAFLCTEGFENLLVIGDQKRSHLYGLHAQINSPLVSRDFSYGVTERTRSDGTVEVDLDEKEIEFVLSKLALAEVKTVAVTFLHSSVNSRHEKQVEEKLKSNGYEVVCSHAFPGNELERAKAACEKAYLTPLRKNFQLELEKLGFKTENIQWGSPPLSNLREILELQCLEDRFLISWEGKHHELTISPLSHVQLDAGGLTHVGPEVLDAEPGPTAFGKGIQLCLLDLLAYKGSLSHDGIPRLKIDSNRVGWQLTPLAKQLQLDADGTATQYISLSIEKMSQEVRRILGRARPLEIHASGWLAPFFGLPLSQKLGARKFLLQKNFPWTPALQLLGEKSPPLSKSFGSFNFEKYKVASKEGEVFAL